MKNQMKKHIIYVGFILGFNVLTACGNSSAETIQPETVSETVSVTETIGTAMTEPEPEPKSESGLEDTSEIPSTEEEMQEMTTVYLEAKCTIHNMQGDGSEEYWWNEKEYDTDGNLTKVVSYDVDGNMDYREEYEYDADGNRIKAVSYNADDTVCTYSEFEYDADGNQVKSVLYNADRSSTVIDQYEYEYDENQTKVLCYDEDGVLQSMVESEYDDKGQEIRTKSIHYDEGDILYEKEDRYEYEYDYEGNVIKNTTYDENGRISAVEESEYNEKGIMVKQKELIYTGEAVSSVFESEYDEHGNPLKKTIYKNDGSIEYLYEYEYIQMQIPDKRKHDEIWLHT